MHVWERLADVLFGLLDRYDELTVFFLVLIEEAGVPLPLPSDLVMVVAGLRIAEGKMGLLWTLFLLEAATLLGASFLYWLAARGGRPLVHRYGRYVRLDHKTLDRVEGRVRAHGGLAVIGGRLFPGLRIVTTVAAGVFGVPYRVFLPATAAGSLIYIAFWVSLGYFLGPEALAILERPRLPLRAALSLVLFVALGAFLLTMYRRSARVRQLPRVAQTEPRRLETSALAGFVATIEMGLGTNALLYALSAIGIREPERTLVDLAHIGAARYFGGDLAQFTVALIALLFLGGIGWALLYAHVFEPTLPGAPWLRGLLFSALPLAFSLLVLLPLLGGGFFGFDLHAEAVPLVGELLRNALFGVGLGTTYALLLAARQPPARLGEPHGARPAETHGARPGEPARQVLTLPDERIGASTAAAPEPSGAPERESDPAVPAGPTVESSPGARGSAGPVPQVDRAEPASGRPSRPLGAPSPEPDPSTAPSATSEAVPGPDGRAADAVPERPPERPA